MADTSLRYYDKACNGAEKQILSNVSLTNVGFTKRGNSFLSQDTRSAKKTKTNLEDVVSHSTMFMADGIECDLHRTGVRHGQIGKLPSKLEFGVSIALKEYLEAKKKSRECSTDAACLADLHREVRSFVLLLFFYVAYSVFMNRFKNVFNYQLKQSLVVLVLMS